MDCLVFTPISDWLRDNSAAFVRVTMIDRCHNTWQVALVYSSVLDSLGYFGKNKLIHSLSPLINNVFIFTLKTLTGNVFTQFHY